MGEWANSKTFACLEYRAKGIFENFSAMPSFENLSSYLA
jgi:hypothetical protein